MSQITTVINVCDRCGSKHDASKYMSGSHWGHLNLAWKGDKGGRTMQGDTGGINLKGDAWLCEPCTDAFLAFIKNKGQS